MIRTELAHQGNFLFRYRSYLPIVFIVPLVMTLARPSPLPVHGPVHQWWMLGCLAVSLLGLAVRIVTIGFVPSGTSGRNTRAQRASVLNTAGMYSVVRHPLYVGNFLIWFGVVLCFADLLVATLFVCAFWLYYERIMAAEEAFLAEQFGVAYQEWAATTPAFIPALRQWRAPDLRFCPRTVLRREYCALLGIGVGFAAVDLAQHVVREGELRVDPIWVPVLAVCLGTFLVLRFLKKRTQVLRVDGR